MPHPVDITVGNTVRELRIRTGLSQQSLGDQIGVSFQQVQKYERGTNRIGSSRLVQIASALSVQVNDLFRGVDQPHADKPLEGGAPLNAKASKVARDWIRIGDTRLQEKTAAMIRALAIEAPTALAAAAE
jgi:transcriptional regulator with XRE-family HTH domain